MPGPAPPTSSSPSSRLPLDGLASGTMLTLCICWGYQQVAIKMAAPDMNSVLQVGLRSFLAAILVAVIMLVRRQSLSLRDGTLRPGILAGILFGVEFIAISVGLHYTTAGHMAVFLYSAPVFAALGLHWFVEGEHLSLRQWSGVILSFVGIAVAWSGSFFTPGGISTSLLIGDALGILAGILWAATTVAIRLTTLAETPPAKTLLYQLTGAAVLILPLSAAQGHFHHIVPTPTLWASLAFQTFVIAFASYLTWFWLLTKYLASRLSVFSFLTPLFGVAFGVLILHEPLDPRFIAGALLVLTGITVVNRKS